jgi:adenylylsulfate kinase
MTSENIFPLKYNNQLRILKEQILHQKGHLFWFTGLSGSGKSTLALRLEDELIKKGITVIVLDGDSLRAGLNSDLQFSESDRGENIRRVAEVANIMVKSGIVVCCSLVSPKNSMREMAKRIVGTEDFSLIFIDTPLEICIQRDSKGLYQKAIQGTIKHFTGISDPFENPETPDLTLATHEDSKEECVKKLLTFALSKIRPDQ